MTEHVNRDDVRGRLDRLRDDYGEMPVLEADEKLSAEHFKQYRADAVDGYTGGGYAWIRRPPGDAPPLAGSMTGVEPTGETQVLLVLERGTDEPTWEVAGGSREGAETYEAAVRREVREETGIDVAVERPYFVFYDRLHSEEDGVDVCLHTLWVCFDATYDGGAIAVQQGELRGAAWFESPPTALGPWAQYRGVEWWDDYALDEPWWDALAE